ASVELARAEHVTTITMANAGRRNALNAELLQGLIDAIEQAGRDGTRAVIIRADPGVSIWSAGHDIDELPRDGSDPLAWTNPLEGLLRAVRKAPMPVICAVEGSVWGGACNLVVACDLVVATRTSTFAITPAKLGIPYNSAGLGHFTGALPVNIAKEMLFTALPLTAEDLARVGLINRLVADEPAMTNAAVELAERISSLAPLSIRAMKAEMNALIDARHLTSDLFEHLTSLRRDAWASADYREGLDSFAERRPPNFTGDVPSRRA
ncbi:MAG: methylmalonyl-CoA decarboxylase, partial [Actinomycetales bacterium]